MPAIWLVLLFVMDQLYFEYIISRETNTYVLFISTFIVFFVNLYTLFYLTKKLFKFLNIN